MLGCTMLAVLTLIASPAAPTMPTPVTYGKPFAVLNPIQLPELSNLAKKKAGKLVQVIGPVHKVCSKKGCWVSLKDGEAHVRISFKQYSFFLPISLAEGTIVVVKGVLSTEKLTQANIAHKEKEGATVPKNGVELTVMAEGVLVKYTNR